MNDIAWLGVADLEGAYRTRKLSPLEVVRALIERIQTHDGSVNSFINVDAEAALKAAEVAEYEIFHGRHRGSLHGVPLGLKDNIDVAGLPTTCHSKLLLNYVPYRDAHVVSGLRAAGAIILGKQSLHEFAFGGPSAELPFPHAKHPWNMEYHPGGSSSGSGVALAAGFAPLSIGTDAGGSIRNPAGSCGLVGLKPTYDLLSRRGVFPVSPSVEHVGPMARTVTDIALAMHELTQVDGYSANSVAGLDISELESGIKGLRVGFVRKFHEEDMIADPQLIAALAEVARVLESEGAIVREVRLPRVQEFAAVHRVILLSEAWNVHAPWLRTRPGDYTTPTRRKVMAGAFLTAGHLAQAQSCRSVLTQAVNDAFQECDVLLTASAMDPVSKIADQAELLRTYSRHARSPFNLTGHPALAMMSGRANNELPLSMQLVGRHLGEATLLRVARAYERATQWIVGNPRPFGR
ncbi:amidase [Methylocella sp. CPCC 101449]|uniref:amidase n=1 Tax=Methylocella sp. CPCC 101449 TaxID=2987531 RepID=UPI00288EE3AB|nr:amidase [Methylocella sp. CPCC 101449]MDT2024577.1 amidase [Methylocella sp. CPCC 101449]